MAMLGVCNGEAEQIELYNAQTATNGFGVTAILTQVPEG